MSRVSARLSEQRSSQPRRREEEEDNENDDATQISVGSKVRKLFEGHGWFQGEVMSYDEDSGFYHVLYDDGDEEEYHQDQLRKLMRAAEEMENTEAQNDVAGDLAAEEEEEYSREEDFDGDDDDDDVSILEYDVDSDEPMATKTSASKSTPRKAKHPTPVVTPSPSSAALKKMKPKTPTSTRKKISKSKPPKSALSSPKGDLKNTMPRSIAVRGLPRGALAKCGKSGLTLRSLDGIPPLHRSSAFFLHHATHPNIQPTKNSSNNPKQQEAPKNSKTTLPGQILVVTRDHHGICPPNFVGKTFASVAALYAALSQTPVVTEGTCLSLAIDYDMEVVADPVFAPWDFVQARLASSGLLDTNDDDDDDGNKGEDMGPLLYVVQIQWDGTSKVSGSVSWYKKFIESAADMDAVNDDLQWAIIEGDQKELPSVLVGAPLSLFLNSQDANVHEMASSGYDETSGGGCGEDLLPPPAAKVAQIRLPASLLQKSIRRGNGLCSGAPLLEACAELLLPQKNSNKNEESLPPPGSTLAMLKTVWGCMLVDASPFDDAENCLGLPSLLLLSLVAKADPGWTMPASLRRAAVAGALRAAKSAPSQPWLGFVTRSDDWWELEEKELTSTTSAAAAAAATTSTSSNPADQKAFNLRSILRAAQAVVGGRLAWGRWNKFIGDASAAAALSYLNDEWDGSYLPAAPSSSVDEVKALLAWEEGKSPGIPTELRLRRLDDECRLSAYEPTVLPHTLVLLQAVLSQPPTSWKKHGLPSLAKQIRKLISEANARVKERVQLARLATWGKAKTETKKVADASSALHGSVSQGQPNVETLSSASYESFREVVTPTGTLSDQEIEVVESFEAIQEWLSDRLQRAHKLQDQDATDCKMRPSPSESTPVEERSSHYSQVKAGPPLTPFDGRVAFLLAFATAIEVEVCADPQSPSSKEVVSAMFCGDPKEPLLVQRIGKARREGKEAATAGGTTSGATAVPSLGYVQRNRSVEEANMIEAAEKAVAAYWNGGITSPLPLPPVGMQWDLPGNIETMDIGWEEKETAVERTAELVEACGGKMEWHFKIAGKDVEPFDARAVVSPCALGRNDQCHRPAKLEPGSERDRFLKLALYIADDSEKKDLPYGKTVLDAMTGLHALAQSDRETIRSRLSEGRVYDWLPLACVSLIPSRTFRDALLAIRTRENDHVILGRGILSDGTGAIRDMVEGVLVRLFHALEMLYPQALRKEGALKFRVRPRGAAYYHLLASLEQLGRGESLIGSPNNIVLKKKAVGVKRQRQDPVASTEEDKEEDLRPTKRPRRSAAVVASKRTKALVKEEMGSSKTKSKKADSCDAHTCEGNGEEEFLPLPKIKTTLWAHQEASVAKVVEGVREGRRGHADASAVGAGKTLAALATIVRLAHWIEESGRSRHGVLVMLPTKALIREWLLEIAAHTSGFQVIEQREDGTLFSLTYGKTHPPIDGNSLIISTLDRVCNHPFVRQTAWDFVVIDECLAVQNAAAKRNPSAWRQIEVSMCGVLLLSATFFRSKYDQLFYMIRMLRSPLPRTMEWLPATIHEHIICQIPETDRKWQMRGEMVPLLSKDLPRYRAIIEAFRRKQINEPREVDGRKLWVDLESFLRSKYEGRESRASYRQTSVMGDAFARVTKGLLRKGRRPLIFADTSQEADFLLRTLGSQGLDACSWASVASKQISTSSKSKGSSSRTVIVAVKTVEGQGINMQRHADCIICRPTPGDHLEQMKGRVDRPGQTKKELLLVVLVSEHTIEEAKFANIRLAGNFFREYIAPVATKYKERIDLEATLAAGGTGKLKTGTVSGTWKRSLEAAGQSGAFAEFDDTASTCTTISTSTSKDSEDYIMEEAFIAKKSSKVKQEKQEPKYKPLNKVLRNRGDPQAVRQAKNLAKSGQASLTVRRWLFPPKVKGSRQQGLAKNSMMRFSDTTPPVVLDRETVFKAVTHLSNSDPKLASLIARVGPDALAYDCGGELRPPTQARLFDRCVRAITFTMVSVDAGNSFLRRLAMKIGACLERKTATIRNKLLRDIFESIRAAGDKDDLNGPEDLLELLLEGKHNLLTFTHPMLRELVNDCEIIKGKRTGYPHLCGVTHPCGKNDDHSAFREKARAHAKGGGDPVSAGFSGAKAGFIVSLVTDFESGKISGEKISKASDREAAKMLIELKGIGDWCAGGVLMHFLSRADIMLYGDLTVRNFLNDLYEINHHDESETLLESAADFADTGPNRNLIDDIATKKGWGPYRSVVCFLMYHLQEENLVLL